MPSLRLHSFSGLLGGYFVYTLICQEDGPLYIKIGMSQNPIKRFAGIRNGNPITPITLAWLELPSRAKAAALEMELHFAATNWHHSLEWFKVPEAEFTEFKAACKAILDRNHSPARPPLKWSHADAQSLITDAMQRRAKFHRVARERGPAYLKFLADSG